jgi:EAL and modified HD-GYP domain-containing signal transduction protein
MATPDLTLFPLVEVHFVANAHNEWVALVLRVSDPATTPAALEALFGTPDLLAAVAPLDCVLLLDDPAVLVPPILALLPCNRVVLAVAASALAREGVAQQLAALHGYGYRVLLDGPVGGGVKRPSALYGVSFDCSASAPPAAALAALSGVHLARKVDSAVRFGECAQAGFNWFSGDYPLHPGPFAPPAHDASSQRRLLDLLALLSRDAESRQLEALLKQDAALSFQLLKLVNSAAFAVSTRITSFGQAINLLGRRQLQRWLQLLLYARQHPDGPPNLLLPLAALRGAQMEMLSRRAGGDRAAEDLAFMTGVFSLLDRLFAAPMAELVGELSLAEQVIAALLRREGPLGQRLLLVESSPDARRLREAGIDRGDWWHSQLHAWHWAIQVGRNI